MLIRGVGDICLVHSANGFEQPVNAIEANRRAQKGGGILLACGHILQRGNVLQKAMVRRSYRTLAVPPSPKWAPGTPSIWAYDFLYQGLLGKKKPPDGGG
jgi:hypothetical protein